MLNLIGNAKAMCCSTNRLS